MLVPIEVKFSTLIDNLSSHELLVAKREESGVINVFLQKERLQQGGRGWCLTTIGTLSCSITRPFGR